MALTWQTKGTIHEPGLAAHRGDAGAAAGGGDRSFAGRLGALYWIARPGGLAVGRLRRIARLFRAQIERISVSPLGRVSIGRPGPDVGTDRPDSGRLLVVAVPPSRPPLPARNRPASRQSGDSPL